MNRNAVWHRIFRVTVSVAAVILFVVCMPIQQGARDTRKFSAKIYEAEKGFYQDFALHSSSTASNGSFLRIGNTGSVRWPVVVERAGWYILRFRYWSPDGESVNNLKKNDTTFPIGFGWSSDWALHEEPVKLMAGENILELSPNRRGMDLDYIQVDTTTLKPTMTPQNNQFYIEFPRELVAKVNTYGRKITHVTADKLPVECNTTAFPYQEDAWWVKIPRHAISALAPGIHSIDVHLDSGEYLRLKATVLPAREPAALTFIFPDISHGAAVIILLPTGKTLLVDCAKSEQRDSTLIPLLQRHQIEKTDYFIITHYHSDHDGDDRGEKIKNDFHVDRFWDNDSLRAGQKFKLEGTTITVLNDGSSGGGSPDLNMSSLAFTLEYKGFVYHHGGDVYAVNQAAMLKKYPQVVQAHLFSANHHFHGSSDVQFMRAMDPCLVVLQAEQAIYARSTYTTVFKKRTVDWLKTNGKRFIEDIPALEVGMVVVRVNDANDWIYETYFDTKSSFVPYLR